MATRRPSWIWELCKYPHKTRHTLKPPIWNWNGYSMCNTLGDICKKHQNYGKNVRQAAIFIFFRNLKKPASCDHNKWPWYQISRKSTKPSLRNLRTRTDGRTDGRKDARTDGQTHGRTDGRTDKTQSYIPRNAVRRGIITRKFTYTAFIHVESTRKLRYILKHTRFEINVVEFTHFPRKKSNFKLLCTVK